MKAHVVEGTLVVYWKISQTVVSVDQFFQSATHLFEMAEIILAKKFSLSFSEGVAIEAGGVL